MLQVLYHVPETRNPDTPALRVLQTLLATGQSSRLYRRMVDREQLALNVFGFAPNALDPTVFTFFIQPRSGVDPAVAEKALSDGPNAWPLGQMRALLETLKELDTVVKRSGFPEQRLMAAGAAQ